jgi:hypothetical protein
MPGFLKAKIVSVVLAAVRPGVTKPGRHAPTPVGTWSANTVRSDNPSTPDPSVISFTAHGSVCLRTPVSSGTGRWWREGHSAFNWEVKEVFQPGPGFPGFVLIHQEGTLDGDTFTSTGESQVFDQNGKFEKKITAKVTGTRTSDSPESTCA